MSHIKSEITFNRVNITGWILKHVSKLVSCILDSQQTDSCSCDKGVLPKLI